MKLLPVGDRLRLRREGSGGLGHGGRAFGRARDGASTGCRVQLGTAWPPPPQLMRFCMSAGQSRDSAGQGAREHRPGRCVRPACCPPRAAPGRALPFTSRGLRHRTCGQCRQGRVSRAVVSPRDKLRPRWEVSSRVHTCTCACGCHRARGAWLASRSRRERALLTYWRNSRGTAATGAAAARDARLSRWRWWPGGPRGSECACEPIICPTAPRERGRACCSAPQGAPSRSGSCFRGCAVSPRRPLGTPSSRVPVLPSVPWVSSRCGPGHAVEGERVTTVFPASSCAFWCPGLLMCSLHTIETPTQSSFK